MVLFLVVSIFCTFFLSFIIYRTLFVTYLNCIQMRMNQIKSNQIYTYSSNNEDITQWQQFSMFFFFLSKSGLLSRFLRWFVWFSSTIAPETHRSIVNRVHEKRWRFKIELFQVCLNKNVFTFVFYLYEIICSQHCQILGKK